MAYGVDVVELFSALLHREPTEWEAEYWTKELEGAGFENVFRRMTASEEHKRFTKDKNLMFVPAGHFYSPVVDQEFVAARSNAIFSEKKRIFGIDFREKSQLSFLETIERTAIILPFDDGPKDGLRYHYDNNAFSYGDAVVYAAMIFHYKPKRILEIGSGFSSALALDVCDMIANYQPEIRFIDPFPKLVRSLVAQNAAANVSIEEAFIQDIPPQNLSYLDNGDIYFMDTTHIVKTSSDVLYHFEEILPRLKSGVIIHLHDIFYPMEYPEPWVTQQRLSWNEIYYFRAFLTNNSDYEIIFWNDFMYKNHQKAMISSSPLFEKNSGASIWLRKK